MLFRSAYIDLNPVRAGICEDPVDYRWCGYAAAVGGDRLARGAIRWLTGPVAGCGAGAELPKWGGASRSWRCYLFGIPDSEAGREEEKAKGGQAVIFRRRISRAKALGVLQDGGKLPLADYLRCRVRSFSDGVAVGGGEFVESVFQASRGQFGPKRKTGARPLRGLEMPGPDETRLHTLRQLQKRVFG